MNFKRCIIRNNLKKTIIRTLSKGLDIEILSFFIDSETEGVGFLDDVTTVIEREVEKEQGTLRYDGETLESIIYIVNSIVDDDMIKSACSDILMNYLRNGNTGIKQGASMKWVNVRGAVEAEFHNHNMYQIQEKLGEITLEAFIYSIVEESEAPIAAKKAFTKVCEKEGLTKKDYPGWYKEAASHSDTE